MSSDSDKSLNDVESSEDESEDYSGEEGSGNSDEESSERTEIRNDLSSMSFEEIMKLKDELGAKVYNEAILGVNRREKHVNKDVNKLKRLNKNRPRELSSKRLVPFLGAELRKQQKQEIEHRDPRFDEKSGEYNINQFKQNYKFITRIRSKEVGQLKKKLSETKDTEESKDIKETMQKLINKNVEDRKWRLKQATLKKEQLEIQKARAEGRQPHYITKKERRTKELVQQFEELKKTGKLNKHLEKRRKKNATKDRKKLSFD